MNLRLSVPFFAVLAILLFAARPAFADWVEVNFSNKRGMTTYIDPQTIQLQGSIAHLWVLSDFRERQQSRWSASYLSEKTQQAFDCTKERSRIVSLTRYSGNMGLGEVVLDGEKSDMDWTTMAPGSINRLLFKAACGGIERKKS